MVCANTTSKGANGDAKISISAMFYLNCIAVSRRYIMPLEKMRILVVDDEPENRALLKILLQQFGAEVLVASGALEGLKLFLESRPQLIISDIAMPEVSGYGLLWRLRSLEKQTGIYRPTPVIAVTGFAGRENRIQILRAGFIEHIAKPYDPFHLISVIKSIDRTEAKQKVQRR
jgi:CheY-like chemotaxis protein